MANKTGLSLFVSRVIRHLPDGMAVRLRLCRVLLTLVLLTGCSPAQRGAREELVTDLAQRLSPVAGSRAQQDTGSAGSFTRHYRVVRQGRQKDALILVAPIAVQAPLARLPRNLVFECQAAAVTNIGDGFQMDIFVTGDGAEKKVYGRYFDAGRRAEDRVWIPVAVPLNLDNMRNPALEIRVTAGPQGDLVYDWLALSEMRLVTLENR